MAYPEQIKAACIALNGMGMSLREVSEVTRIPHATIHHWTVGEDAPETVYEKSDAYAKDLAALFEELAYKAVNQSKQTMDKAGPYQAAMIGAVAVDKMRLLREQPTQIHRTTEERRLALIALLSPSDPPLVECETVTEPEPGEAPIEG